MKRTPVGRSVVIDARCLQDPNYSRRGVGRHALALLRGFPTASGFRPVGLIDPSLPALIEEAAAEFAALCINSYAAHAGAPVEARPAAFVSLSPMTHNPLFAARLLADASLLRMGVVYDFIPRRNAARYLPGEAERLDYTVRLHWLARCDLFAPISRSSADDLAAVLRVDPRRITVTGAPLDQAFENITPWLGPARHQHVLVVGGGDARKNPEAVVRAHARSTKLQTDGVPLLIAGNYGPAEARAFRDLSAATGGRPSLVEVPGHVPDETLMSLYQKARVVVCASRDEGFSLPVVEGMAVGAVVLASDIPAHAELVPDAQRRFPPEDDKALSALLARAWVDDQWRVGVLAEQSRVWPHFRAANVAQRFWTSLLAGLAAPLAAPSVLARRRPRLALLSPLPPDRSGVADYTAATCAELGKLVELHVFSETKNTVAVPFAASVRPLDALPCLLPGFDRVIGVLGNSHFHLRIFELLQAYGGAAIAHDARMLGFYRILLGEPRALAEASRELGRTVTSAELNTWLGDERTLEALFLGEIAMAASPMIVHSPVTAEMVKQRHGIAPVRLPFSIYRPLSPQDLTDSSRFAARQRLRLHANEIILVSFGHVHASKAPQECIWALDFLRRWKMPAQLHFVGSVGELADGGEGLLSLAKSLGLHQHLKMLGEYVSEQTYSDYLVGADVAIQLRTYGLGGLSGALLDCAAAGLPVVANIGLVKALGLSQSYIRSIPNELSPLLLAEAVADLVGSGMTRARPEAERRIFSEERSFRVYCRSLCDALNLDTAA